MFKLVSFNKKYIKRHKLINVLYCDDEMSQRDRFYKLHHGNEFTVEVEADVDCLPRRLSQLNKLPDLLVLDLFHPFVEADPAEATRINNEVNVTVGQINELMIKVRRQADELFAPRAISVLREIRKNPKLERLPVILYTRYGICTVNDEEMKEAISLSADWLLKGRTPEAEKRMMYQVTTEHSKLKSFPRDTKLAIWSSIFSAILGTIFGWLITKL